MMVPSSPAPPLDSFAILAELARWRSQGRRAALATVIATWGSSPRPVGSLMAVDEAGAMLGSVSGGCIEGAVVLEARKTIADGEPRRLSFGVTDEMAWEVGLACGGRVEIQVEAMDRRGRVLDSLLAARDAKHPVALATDLSTGHHTIVHDAVQEGDAALPDDILAAVRAFLAADRSGMVERDGTFWFVRSFNPPLRLIIVGAVHIAQALAPVAALAGFAVTVVDPRGAFATDERFPDVTLDGDWPDEALARLKPDSRTAVVTLTHDPKLDDPALVQALSSPAFHIGALGSRKTHARRMDRLRAAGVAEGALSRIRGPVGLDIGAVTPAEIAISVMAGLIADLRGGPKHRE